MIVLNKFLSIKDFIQIVNHNHSFTIDQSILSKVESNFNFLQDFSRDKVIYGVNTGFGPMAQYLISEENKIQLQYNLIRSHSSGTGAVIPAAHIRAALLARLNSLSKAKSGIHPEVIQLLQKMIQNDVLPVIFEHGGVGASGDLVQLAHVALSLIGEGEVLYNGERRDTSEVFRELNISPLQMHIREGLALMNGTSVMTGIGILNFTNAEKLIHWSVNCACLISELVRAYDDHYSAELNEVKLHPGQSEIARQMRDHLADSSLIRKREDDLYSGRSKDTIFKEKVQEYYSIRCVPQILGAIFDTVIHVGEVLEDELNSANDNPIIDDDRKHVFHGGNFHGDYIALEMDKLKIVVTKLTMLAERQLNFLLNPNNNGILPPFINRGILGLNYGIQGAQFSATSTTAESQTLSNPMYIHSIPCNNDNQDIVSMGTNAAQMTARVIENAFEVLSIEMIAIIQAIAHTNIETKLSSHSRKIFDDLSAFIPDIVEDKPLYQLIQQTKDFLRK